MATMPLKRETSRSMAPLDEPPRSQEPIAEAPDRGEQHAEPPEDVIVRQAEAPDAGDGRAGLLEQEFTVGRCQS